MRFWKNTCGCGKPLVLDHYIRSHWIATIEGEGKANLCKLKKKGGISLQNAMYMAGRIL
jgi:hypothetical protein